MERITYPRIGEDLYRTVLPNGLPILVVPKPGFTRKLAYFATDFGAVHNHFTLDGREVHAPDGVAHYLEHKLFDMPGGRDVTAEFAALGAVPNAFTSHDLTVYYFSCTESFEPCLDLLLEYVSTPYFTDESVQKEQGIIGQEIGMDADTPESRVFQNLMKIMYREHPVRVDVLGTVDTIARITPQVLYDCHRAFYHPGNMLLTVVGDVDPAEVERIAMARLGCEPAPHVEQSRVWNEKMTCESAYVEEAMEVAMPMFQIGFKCEPLGKGEAAIKEEMVADLAAEALFGESSALYSRRRFRDHRRHGHADGVRRQPGAGHRPGCPAGTGPDPGTGRLGRAGIPADEAQRHGPPDPGSGQLQLHLLPAVRLPFLRLRLFPFPGNLRNHHRRRHSGVPGPGGHRKAVRPVGHQSVRGGVL